MNKQNKSNATGLDGISARLIRECADLIRVRIRDIFYQSISQGKFPEDCKSARVTPLFKQGDRPDVNNYRPISVIPVVVKVFERINSLRTVICLFSDARYAMQISVGFSSYTFNCCRFA